MIVVDFAGFHSCPSLFCRVPGLLEYLIRAVHHPQDRWKENAEIGILTLSGKLNSGEIKMLLKEIMSPNSDARKSKSHINVVSDKSVINDISQRLIAKGINPTPKNIKLYLLLFSDPYPAWWISISRTHNYATFWTESAVMSLKLWGAWLSKKPKMPHYPSSITLIHLRLLNTQSGWWEGMYFWTMMKLKVTEPAQFSLGSIESHVRP